MFPFKFFKSVNRSIDRLMDKAGYGPLNMKQFFKLGCARESIRYINCSQHQLWFEFQTAYGWAEYKLDWDDICHHVELKFELPDESICWRFGD